MACKNLPVSRMWFDKTELRNDESIIVEKICHKHEEKKNISTHKRMSYIITKLIGLTCESKLDRKNINDLLRNTKNE